MSFAVLLNAAVAPQCHLSNDALVLQLILRPLSAILCSNGPSIVFHSSTVSNPFPFGLCYAFTNVRYSCSVPNVNVLNSFTVTNNILHSSLACFKLLFCSLCMSGICMSLLVKHTGRRPFLQTDGKCLSRKIYICAFKNKTKNKNKQKTFN